MTDNEYIDVSNTAAEVGSGFNILKAPVLISKKLWDICVQWSDKDTEVQDYQEQDARLWDVLFVCGTTLEMNIQQFMGSMSHQYHILVIPRDGVSKNPVKAMLSAHANPEQGTLLIDLLELVPYEEDEW